MEAAAGGGDVNAAPVPPVVFFCSKCKAIISDSTQFLFSVRSLNLLVVKGANGIKIDRNEVIDRPQQPDWRSVAVHCSSCRAHLGRVYKAITGDLSLLKDLISLSVATVGSYELGRCEVAVQGAPESGSSATLHDLGLLSSSVCAGRSSLMQHSQELPAAAAAAAAAAGAAAAQQQQQRIDDLEAELIKVKSMLMGMSERLEHVERCTTTAVAGSSRKRPHVQDLGPPQPFFLPPGSGSGTGLAEYPTLPGTGGGHHVGTMGGGGGGLPHGPGGSAQWNMATPAGLVAASAAGAAAAAGSPCVGMHSPAGAPHRAASIGYGPMGGGGGGVAGHAQQTVAGGGGSGGGGHLDAPHLHPAVAAAAAAAAAAAVAQQQQQQHHHHHQQQAQLQALVVEQDGGSYDDLLAAGTGHGGHGHSGSL